MGLCQKLSRRKTQTNWDLHATELKRCLTTLDLTALGVGSTLGAGAYVLAGQVAKTQAGPAIILSFLIAAFASFMAAMCYAEFAARFPLSGSAYTYTYCSVGELWAFVIGWNLLLEYVIASASVARTVTGYVDSLLGNQMIPFMSKHLQVNVPSLAHYADIFAFTIILLFTLILAVGVKESATVTKLFTLVNVCVLSFVCIMGIFNLNVDNWAQSTKHLPNATICGALFERRERESVSAECCERSDGCGAGGFFPFGVDGVLSAAATCFFAFVGFDVIATTGEEAENPRRSIPIAVLVSLSICCFLYVATSATLTLVTPYFELDSEAPFAVSFNQAGYPVSAIVISCGAVFALSTSLLAGMFPMPRVLFAMARDGLVFRILAQVNGAVKTPVLATMLTGLLAGIMAMLFDVGSLVEMMSIGTLLAYTLVAVSVLLLRYETCVRTMSVAGSVEERVAPSGLRLLVWAVGVCVVLLGGISSQFSLYDPLTLVIVVSLAICVVVLMAMIDRYPRGEENLSFAVPCVPAFPIMSMLVNVWLMFRLRFVTWMRFFVWLFVGLFIYAGYGIRHSNEESNLQFEPNTADHLLAQVLGCFSFLIPIKHLPIMICDQYFVENSKFEYIPLLAGVGCFLFDAFTFEFLHISPSVLS